MPAAAELAPWLESGAGASARAASNPLTITLASPDFDAGPMLCPALLHRIHLDGMGTFRGTRASVYGLGPDLGAAGTSIPSITPGFTATTLATHDFYIAFPVSAAHAAILRTRPVLVAACIAMRLGGSHRFS